MRRGRAHSSTVWGIPKPCPNPPRHVVSCRAATGRFKFDRQGNRRTLYSLRHGYISFRLLEGADIYQIAKNCRTSVEMIEKHYAVHLKNSLDAAAINVRPPRPSLKSMG